jgi:hypothetical protein
MNRLLTKAPSHLEIGGAFLPIDIDFRSALLTFAAFGSPDLTDEERQGVMIHNLFGPVEYFSTEMIHKAIWFLKCGKESKTAQERPIVDFNHDAQRIYEAFLKRGVNLDTAKLHWWTFMGMFAELPECSLTRIMHLRHQSNHNKLTKHEREECSRIGWDVIIIKNSLDSIEAPDWIQ